MELNAEQEVHLAAQYLAAFAINYVVPNEDDSHTNLGFDPNNKTLSSRSFGENQCRLDFEYESFSLKLRAKEQSFKLFLDGKIHLDIIAWINENLKLMNVKKTYDYSFHYEIPYKITEDYEFKKPSKDRISSLVSLRILAHKAMGDFLSNLDANGEIRIWPHHFDSGVMMNLDVNNRQMGLGLAIPDEMIDTYYFYASGYGPKGAIAVDQYDSLKHGDWKSGDFNGAILKAQELEVADVLHFFEETMYNYKK